MRHMRIAPEDALRLESDEPAIPTPQRLIRFEALSRWSWIDVGRSDAGHVVILGNDHWTASFTTTLRRRKVATQFAALIQTHVHHADSENSALWASRR